MLLAVRGLQMGTGASAGSERDRLLGERLLTIEWQQREVPEKTVTEPGTWLLVSTSEAADMVATQLTDALKVHDAQMHDDVLAAASRPPGARPNGCATSSTPVRSTAWSSSPDRRTATRTSRCLRSRAASTSSIWCASPASCPKCLGRTAPAVRRDPQRPDGAWPATAPTSSRAACVVCCG